MADKTIEELLNDKSPGAVISHMWNRGDGGFVVEIRWWGKLPFTGLRKAVGQGGTRTEAIANACSQEGKPVH